MKRITVVTKLGTEFYNIQSYSFNSEFLRIVTEDNTEVVYNMNKVIYFEANIVKY